MDNKAVGTRGDRLTKGASRYVRSWEEGGTEVFNITTSSG